MHGSPAAGTVGGAAAASAAAVARRPSGNSVRSGSRGDFGVHEASSWYVPGSGSPASFVLYAPAGTKNVAIQTSTSTAASTVNAVGKRNLRFGASGSLPASESGPAGGATDVVASCS